MTSTIQENKKLQRFYASDKLPRKRLRCALDFVRSSPLIVVEEFWSENSSTMYGVIMNCVEFLEQVYLPHPSTFGKMKKKTFDVEDWVELFDAIELLILSNTEKISRGWQNNGFNNLFNKFLLSDNHPFIRMKAFRSLLLYIDAVRPEGFDGPHMSSLYHTIDFSPFSMGDIELPSRKPGKVEGWEKTDAISTEEPLSMMKHFLDFMLGAPEKMGLERPPTSSIMTNMDKDIEQTLQSRFAFWCERFMKLFLPILYPQICKKVGYKAENSNTGFFHQCPPPFQHLVARWFGKCVQDPVYMDILWSKDPYVQILFETFRQRFAEKDSELTLDILNIYASWCDQTNYIPQEMNKNILVIVRSMISHVVLLFVPVAATGSPKSLEVIMTATTLLDRISRLELDNETYEYLRKSVLSSVNNCLSVYETPVNALAIPSQLAVILHIWMYTNSHNLEFQDESIIWEELRDAVFGWLTNAPFINDLGANLIQRWHSEISKLSKLLLEIFQQENTWHGDIPTLEPARSNTGDAPTPSPPKLPQRQISTPEYGNKNNRNDRVGLPSARTSITNLDFSFQIHSKDAGLLLLDRVLHVIPPSTIESLDATMHLILTKSVLDLIKLWLEEGVASRTFLIAPSTLLSVFGPWIFPTCDNADPSYMESRSIAIETLCCICFTRCELQLPMPYICQLATILHSGLQSRQALIISTILKHAHCIFTMDFPGINLLIPQFVCVIEEMLCGSSTSVVAYDTATLKSALVVVFSLLSLPNRYPDLQLGSWNSQIKKCATDIQSEAELWKIMENSVEFPQLKPVLANILVKPLSNENLDDELKVMCLWGLFILITIERSNCHENKNTTNMEEDEENDADAADVDNEGRNAMDTSLLKSWVITICEICRGKNTSLAITAVGVLSCISQYFDVLRTSEASLIPHILMALSLMAQQQVEDASLEVQATVEQLQSRLETTTSSNTSSSTIKKKTRQQNSTSEPLLVANKVIQESASMLDSISARTTAIFECMKLWLMMDSASILTDPAVSQIVFAAIEAALVGILPGGQWQELVERERQRKGIESIPLLFLGLQMRMSLTKEKNASSSLKCFEGAAHAAEALLLHLLHHFHNFPSYVGADQLCSSCTEFSTSKEEMENSLSFLYMNSMIITILEGSDKARVIVRDMAGTYTWESFDMNPILSNNEDISKLSELKIGDVKKTSPLHLQQESYSSSSNVVKVELVNQHYPPLPHHYPPLPHHYPPPHHHYPQEKSIVLKVVTCKKKEEEQPPLQQPPVQQESVQHIDLNEVHRYSDEDGPFDANVRLSQSTDEEASEEDTLLMNVPFSSSTNDGRIGTTTTGTTTTGTILDGGNMEIPMEEEERTIGGIYKIDDNQLGVGHLDHEKDLLDLFVDSLPMYFADCKIDDVPDRTFLGGKEIMQRYIQEETKNQIKSSNSWFTGPDVMERVLYDDQVHQAFKSFLANDSSGSHHIDFWEKVRKYKNSSLEDRQAHAAVVFWEYFSAESSKPIEFPSSVIEFIKEAFEKLVFQENLFQEALNQVEETLTKTYFPDFLKSDLSMDVKLYLELESMDETIREYQKEMQTQMENHPPHIQSVEPDASGQDHTPFEKCCLFLSQFGFLPAKSTSHIKLLDNTSKLQRSLKHLDNTPSRESMKIGVIYVGPGQTTQEQILRNTCGGAEYEEFLLGLGWKVDLSSHQGFAGGLDCNPKTLTNGESAIYYASSSTEVIYHTVTQMPTHPSDPQQINKKRHVGNDFVHIVWSDNPNVYAADTITSHFNDVQIVISPMKITHKGMYRIGIHAKEKIPPFGPLLNGMVVSKAILATLVRQTAINANRCCRSKTSIYLPPYPTRKKLILEIRDRYAVEYTDREILGRLLSPNVSRFS